MPLHNSNFTSRHNLVGLIFLKKQSLHELSSTWSTFCHSLLNVAKIFSCHCSWIIKLYFYTKFRCKTIFADIKHAILGFSAMCKNFTKVSTWVFQTSLFISLWTSNKWFADQYQSPEHTLSSNSLNKALLQTWAPVKLAFKWVSCKKSGPI